MVQVSGLRQLGSGYHVAGDEVYAPGRRGFECRPWSVSGVWD